MLSKNETNELYDTIGAMLGLESLAGGDKALLRRARYLAGILVSAASEPSEPSIAGKAITFSGEDTVLYLQIDGDDVLGLEEQENGSIQAFLINAELPVSGWIPRTTIWPIHASRCDCDCDSAFVPGTFGANGFRRNVPCAIADAEEVREIESCDLCTRFDGDLEAAQAVADKVGGRVHYERAEDNVEHIRSGTAPWVVVSEEPGPPVIHKFSGDDY